MFGIVYDNIVIHLTDLILKLCFSQNMLNKNDARLFGKEKCYTN